MSAVPTAQPPAIGGRDRLLRTARRLRFGHGLAVVLALALAIRLVAIAASPHFRPVDDAADYDRYAVSFVQHGSPPDSQLRPGPTAFRAPLFPIVLAGAYELTGVRSASDRWEGGRILEAVLGTLTVALISLIALRLWGAAAALVAGTLAALFLPLVMVGESLMSESLYVPLGLAAVLAALKSRDSPRPLWWALLAGLMVGLASLTRATELVLLLPIVFLVWRRPRLALAALRAPLTAIAVALLTLVPWIIRDADVMHQFVPITDESGYALLGAYNDYAAHRTDDPALWSPLLREPAKVLRVADRGNEAEVSSHFDTLTVDYIKAHPAYPLKVGLWSTLRLFNLVGVRFERQIEPTWGFARGVATWSVYAFWVLGPLALLGAVTKTARRAPLAFWMCPVVLLLATVFVVGAGRYRSPADPFLVMLAALAVMAAGRWARIRLASTAA
jgi:4-amino-4-deoxy-L-arabinose transferase-like glycosyltransferase